MQKNNGITFNPRWNALAAAVLAAVSAGSVQAVEVNVGNPDFSVRFDNTVKYNYGVRTESADKRILGTPGANDGDYNFRHAGTNITNRVDLLTEFDVIYKEDMGFRVSAASWYDKAYENVGSNSNPFVNGAQPFAGQITPQSNSLITSDTLTNPSAHLSNYAQRYYAGPSGEVLDAFVFYSTEVGEQSLLSFKVGQTNSFWGETLLNSVHSLSYGQAGIDGAKLASAPGTEAKELFIPRNQVSTSFTLNSEWTFGGQYFLDWDPARLPESGTYYGSNDGIGQSAQSVVLGHSSPGGVGPNMGAIDANGLTPVPRSKDYEPANSGDWGLMAKWSPQWLDGTLGFYYRNTSDIFPQTYVGGAHITFGTATVTGAQFGPGGICQGLGALDCVSKQARANFVNSLEDSKYGYDYAEDIDIFGISLSKNFAGISVGSDLNYRRNMPLASIPAIYNPELLQDSIVQLCTATGCNPFNINAQFPPRSLATGIVDTNDIGSDAFATGDTLHFTVNALTTFGNNAVFDSASLLGEVWSSYLVKLNDKYSALYKGKDTYHGLDASTRSNVGISVNFTPTWYQVFPGIDMTAPISVTTGIDGVSPVQGGGAKDTGNYSLGVGAQIYNKYFVDLKYVDAFGSAEKCDASTPDAQISNSDQGDGSTPNAFYPNQGYTCYEGGYSSFSGPSGAIEDRGAVYLTFKTTI